MIEMELDDSLTDEVARKESLRARKLAQSHMVLSESPNIFMVKSLEEMQEVSITLFNTAKTLVELSQVYNPSYKRFIESRTENERLKAAMLSGKLGSAAHKLANQT